MGSRLISFGYGTLKSIIKRQSRDCLKKKCLCIDASRNKYKRTEYTIMEKLKKNLFEDAADLGDIEKPTDFRYMKALRLNLILINAWPGKEIGEKNPNTWVHSVAQIVLNVFCWSTGISFLVLHSDIGFYQMGHMIITVLMGINAFTRIIVTLPQNKKYRTLITEFLTKTHVFFFKDKSEYAMEMYRKVHLISHLFTICLTGQMFCGIILFNSIPIWSNYSSGKYKEKVLYNQTYEQTLYLSLPFDVSTNFNAHIGSCVYNCFMSYLCSTSFCMVDLLLSLIVFNIWGHFKILLNDLATFPLPANKVVLLMEDKTVSVTAEMYSKEELKVISHKLKRCIDYHRLIAAFTDDMSEAFGPVLLVYYAFHQVSGCLLLLECSQMTPEALMRYVPLSIILFQQLIQLSIIFELIGSTSEKLKDAVYGVPWQYMDTDNRKIVAIFLYNVQEPIHIKALGVVSVGVTTMATILKTSLSYFTFLRSV